MFAARLAAVLAPSSPDLMVNATAAAADAAAAAAGGSAAGQQGVAVAPPVTSQFPATAVITAAFLAAAAIGSFALLSVAAREKRAEAVFDAALAADPHVAALRALTNVKGETWAPDARISRSIAKGAPGKWGLKNKSDGVLVSPDFYAATLFDSQTRYPLTHHLAEGSSSSRGGGTAALSSAADAHATDPSSSASSSSSKDAFAAMPRTPVAPPSSNRRAGGGVPGSAGASSPLELPLSTTPAMRASSASVQARGRTGGNDDDEHDAHADSATSARAASYTPRELRDAAAASSSSSRRQSDSDAALAVGGASSDLTLVAESELMQLDRFMLLTQKVKQQRPLPHDITSGSDGAFSATESRSAVDHSHTGESIASRLSGRARLRLLMLRLLYCHPCTSLWLKYDPEAPRVHRWIHILTRVAAVPLAVVCSLLLLSAAAASGGGSSTLNTWFPWSPTYVNATPPGPAMAGVLAGVALALLLPVHALLVILFTWAGHVAFAAKHPQLVNGIAASKDAQASYGALPLSELERRLSDLRDTLANVLDVHRRLDTTAAPSKSKSPETNGSSPELSSSALSPVSPSGAVRGGSGGGGSFMSDAIAALTILNVTVDQSDVCKEGSSSSGDSAMTSSSAAAPRASPRRSTPAAAGTHTSSSTHRHNRLRLAAFSSGGFPVGQLAAIHAPHPVIGGGSKSANSRVASGPPLAQSLLQLQELLLRASGRTTQQQVSPAASVRDWSSSPNTHSDADAAARLLAVLSVVAFAMCVIALVSFSVASAVACAVLIHIHGDVAVTPLFTASVLAVALDLVLWFPAQLSVAGVCCGARRRGARQQQQPQEQLDNGGISEDALLPFLPARFESSAIPTAMGVASGVSPALSLVLMQPSHSDAEAVYSAVRTAENASPAASAALRRRHALLMQLFVAEQLLAAALLAVSAAASHDVIVSSPRTSARSKLAEGTPAAAATASPGRLGPSPRLGPAALSQRAASARHSESARGVGAGALPGTSLAGTTGDDDDDSATMIDHAAAADRASGVAGTMPPKRGRSSVRAVVGGGARVGAAAGTSENMMRSLRGYRSPTRNGTSPSKRATAGDDDGNGAQEEEGALAPSPPKTPKSPSFDVDPKIRSLRGYRSPTRRPGSPSRESGNRPGAAAAATESDARPTATVMEATPQSSTPPDDEVGEAAENRVARSLRAGGYRSPTRRRNGSPTRLSSQGDAGSSSSGQRGQVPRSSSRGDDALAMSSGGQTSSSAVPLARRSRSATRAHLHENAPSSVMASLKRGGYRSPTRKGSPTRRAPTHVVTEEGEAASSPVDDHSRRPQSSPSSAVSPPDAARSSPPDANANPLLQSLRPYRSPRRRQQVKSTGNDNDDDDDDDGGEEEGDVGFRGQTSSSGSVVPRPPPSRRTGTSSSEQKPERPRGALDSTRLPVAAVPVVVSAQLGAAGSLRLHPPRPPHAVGAAATLIPGARGGSSRDVSSAAAKGSEQQVNALFSSARDIRSSSGVTPSETVVTAQNTRVVLPQLRLSSASAVVDAIRGRGGDGGGAATQPHVPRLPLQAHLQQQQQSRPVGAPPRVQLQPQPSGAESSSRPSLDVGVEERVIATAPRSTLTPPVGGASVMRAGGNIAAVPPSRRRAPPSAPFVTAAVPAHSLDSWEASLSVQQLQQQHIAAQRSRHMIISAPAPPGNYADVNSLNFSPGEAEAEPGVSSTVASMSASGALGSASPAMFPSARTRAWHGGLGGDTLGGGASGGGGALPGEVASSRGSNRTARVPQPPQPPPSK